MRTILVCGALLGLAACGRKPAKSDEPAVGLPTRTTAVAIEPIAPDSITITLTADGRILARGSACSVEGLEGLLKRSVRHHGPAWHGSTVVRLRIDRAAPWIHVRWLVHTAMVCLVHELRFVYHDAELGEVDVRSTVSPLIVEPMESSYIDVVRLRVVVDATGRIRCGERVARDPRAVSAWAAEAAARVRDEGLAGIRAQLAPRDGTPWGTVAAVHERLRSGTAGQVSFAGSELRPDDGIRGLDRLPTPAAAGRAADGSDDLGGMKVESVSRFEGAEFDPMSSEWDELPLEEPEPEIPGTPARDR